MTASHGGNRAEGGGELIFLEFSSARLTASEVQESQGGQQGDTLLGADGCHFLEAACVWGLSL